MPSFRLSTATTSTAAAFASAAFAVAALFPCPAVSAAPDNAPRVTFEQTLLPKRLASAASAQDASAQPAVAPAPTTGFAPDGRPTAVLDDAPGVFLERERIKHTVPLDTTALTSQWDVLYTLPAGEGGDGVRVAYCDWDNNYLYLAWESPQPEAIRVDLDCSDDGWIRGADNLSFQVQPAPDGVPQVTTQRFDTVQNRDRPVFAASPIAASEVNIAAGPTGRGTYAVLLAIPRTEVAGLDRKPGKRFGLRIEHGAAAAPVANADPVAAAQLMGKAMLRLALAEEVAAAGDGLKVELKILGPRDAAEGEGVRAVLDVRNESQSEARVGRFFIRGYGAAQSLVDSTTQTGESIPPGKKVSRELRTAIAPTTPLGSLVLVGGVERESRTPLASLASFSYVEPYAVQLKLDQRPIAVGADGAAVKPEDAKRGIAVTVISRVKGLATADVTLAVPTGWLVEGGAMRRTMTLNGDGNQKAFTCRLVPPSMLTPGEQKVEVSAVIKGKTYSTAAVLNVQGPAAVETNEHSSN